jgi:hypothetical protein
VPNDRRITCENFPDLFGTSRAAKPIELCHAHDVTGRGHQLCQLAVDRHARR